MKRNTISIITGMIAIAVLAAAFTLAALTQQLSAAGRTTALKPTTTSFSSFNRT